MISFSLPPEWFILPLFSLIPFSLASQSTSPFCDHILSLSSVISPLNNLILRLSSVVLLSLSPQPSNSLSFLNLLLSSGAYSLFSLVILFSFFLQWSYSISLSSHSSHSLSLSLLSLSLPLSPHSSHSLSLSSLFSFSFSSHSPHDEGEKYLCM